MPRNNQTALWELLRAACPYGPAERDELLLDTWASALDELGVIAPDSYTYEFANSEHPNNDTDA